MKRVDFGAAVFSEADELIGTVYVDDKARVNWRDKAIAAEMKSLEAKFPGKQVNRVGRTRDESVWLISVSADTEPGETYVYVPKTKKLTLQFKIREKLPRASLALMKPVRYKSSDGLEIPAYLTLPKGGPAKNLPAVMFVHGGPWARDGWGYNTMHQFLANRGYAVLSMNFRGSTGFGKQFLNAGNNEWGQKMQDDITWGVKYLVNEGIADPKKVAIMGGSYGGYATLAGVAFTPDVYAAGFSIVGPSNLQTLLDSIPPYWEAGRVIMYKRMGDPRTEEGKKQMARQSPLHSANKIRTPLVVVQGANDPRVKQAESDQIVIALRDRKFPVKYLVAGDEGHGFAKPINNLAMMVAAERFFQQYLGGRSQPDLPEDVAKKLDELTVDPAKVTLAKKIEVSQSNAPRPVRGLAAGTYQYNATIEAGTQKVNLAMSAEIKQGPDGWSVTEKMTTPGGEMMDNALLDTATLALRKRNVKQGPVAIEMTATDEKVMGTFTMGGNTKTIDSATGGPLIGEVAPGFTLGALPLAEGYETAFRGYDLMQMKPKVTAAKVVAVEKVMVPAGEFETFKVEAKSDQGTITYWIDKEGRKLVKMSASLPQMGGAKLTTELK
ncbi:MAG: S9 family peptidase, partial [Acidobacteria bacterium]|nr:S9 family peptidase [Acidobacteriota bacterium]